MSSKTAKRATPTRAKNWMFTINGDIEWDFPKEKYQYLVYQDEIGWGEIKKSQSLKYSDCKTHTQGYIEFKVPMSMAGIKKLHPGLRTVHFEKAFSTPLVCKSYCMKAWEVLRVPGSDANLMSNEMVDALIKAEGHTKEAKGIVRIYNPDKPLKTDKIISIGVPNTFVEEGTLSVTAGKSQGSRTDLKQIQDAVKGGKTLAEIADKYTAFYKYHVGIQKHIELRRLTERNIVKPFPDIYWFFGDPRQGKGMHALDLLGGEEKEDETYYKYEKSANGWWDNYDGQEDLFLNEMFEDTFHPAFWLELFDRTGVKVPRKGLSAVRCKPSRIVVTSMKNPLLWFQDDELTHKAWCARIKGRSFEVKDFKLIGPNASWLYSKFEFPDYKQIVEEEDKLKAELEEKIPKQKLEYTGFRFTKALESLSLDEFELKNGGAIESKLIEEYDENDDPDEEDDHEDIDPFCKTCTECKLGLEKDPFFICDKHRSLVIRDYKRECGWDRMECTNKCLIHADTCSCGKGKRL